MVKSRFVKFLTTLACLNYTPTLFAAPKDELFKACMEHNEKVQKQPPGSGKKSCECLADKIDKNSKLSSEKKVDMARNWTDTMKEKSRQEQKDKDYIRRVTTHMNALNECVKENGGWQ